MLLLCCCCCFHVVAMLQLLLELLLLFSLGVMLPLLFFPVHFHVPLLFFVALLLTVVDLVLMLFVKQATLLHKSVMFIVACCHVEMFLLL